jgi:hypothetical protein
MTSKFTINNIKIIGVSSYNLPYNEDCTICRNNLNINSIYNQDKGIDSKIAIGICGHSYHEECINGWINVNTTCPICVNQWKTNKVIKN